MSVGSTFIRSLTASIFVGFPRPLQFQETIFITYYWGWIGPPPFRDLILVFLPIDISMVGWLPWVFCLSASSSLASLRDFLPALLAGLSRISSSEELDGSITFFLAMSAYVGEGATSRVPSVCPCSPVSFPFGGGLECVLLSIISGSSVSLLTFSV
jgi:hypothetical protein